MKAPYLDEHQRFILKLNRGNKIYTPTFLISYELKVAWRRFTRKVKKNYHIIWWFYVILFITFLILLLSCGKDDDGFKVYTVKAGHNKCRAVDIPPQIGWNQNSIQFTFMTDPGWLILDNGVWNKVTGLSNGNHMRSSCRVGTKAVGDSLDFCMFVHKDGDFSWKYIGRYPCYGRYYVDIGRVGSEWWMWFEGVCYKMDADEYDKLLPNYICRPFVGGDETKVVEKDWDVKIRFEM